nr:hypothetical protein CFP56_29964 [Quercus suber]
MQDGIDEYRRVYSPIISMTVLRTMLQSLQHRFISRASQTSLHSNHGEGLILISKALSEDAMSDFTRDHLSGREPGKLVLVEIVQH